MKNIKAIITWLFGILIFVYMLIIGFSNNQLVDFNYFFATTQIKLSLLLVIIFVIAFVLSWFLMLIIYLREKLKNRKLTRQLNKLQQELTDIKIQALKLEE